MTSTARGSAGQDQPGHGSQASAPPRTTQGVMIPGPAGALEGILDIPGGEPPAAAVFCHPHPLHGGAMHNKVVYRAAKGAVTAGLPTLRFNFRGVGRSAGQHDGGRGEGEDLRAALAFLRARFPVSPLLVGGFSFGAAVGLRVGASHEDIAALVGMGLPLSQVSFDFLAAETRPLLLIQGEEDPFGSVVALRRLVQRLPDSVRLLTFPGEGHFFSGALSQLAAAVTDFCRLHLNGRNPGASSP
ncbi:MAG: alpha/beta hydrolase [Acidobacteria bacterium]|nr:alpha/beta hydrolase [Acidobacteriota bacterium]